MQIVTEIADGLKFQPPRSINLLLSLLFRGRPPAA